MQRNTAMLAASGANETAGPAPLEQERRAPRLVRKRFVKLGKRTPPRHRSFIPAIPHSRLDRSHTICSTYLSQRDKPSELPLMDWQNVAPALISKISSRATTISALKPSPIRTSL